MKVLSRRGEKEAFSAAYSHTTLLSWGGIKNHELIKWKLGNRNDIIDSVTNWILHFTVHDEAK